MNNHEIMKLINEIEELFPVDTWVVDDIHVWPLIRLSLASNLYRYTNNSNIELAQRKRQYISKIQKTVFGLVASLKATLLDKVNNDLWHRHADAVFLSDSSCRIQLIDKWYDRYCEPFIEEFKKIGWSTILYETTGNYEYRVSRSNKSVLIQTQMDIAKIKSILTINRKNIKFNLSEWDGFVSYCYKKRIENYVCSVQELLNRVNTINIVSNMFKIRLRINRPKLAFVECYYSEQGMAFNLACKQLGIPSIDIQHGVQGDNHEAYGRWNKIPNDGYELLPSHFWCWTSSETKAIDKWSNNLTCETHKPLVGSNLWLEKWLSGDSDIVQIYDSLIGEIVDDNHINILYTLQPGYDPQPWFYHAVNNSPSNWKWFIRLHHNMIHERERVRIMFNTNCTNNTVCIDAATDLPLLAWLRHIDVHVTQSSSCVIEAEAFGLRSVITHINGVSLFENQINNGTAVIAFDMDDFLKSICHLINNGEKQTINRKSSNIDFPDLIDEIMDCSSKKSLSS